MPREQSSRAGVWFCSGCHNISNRGTNRRRRASQKTYIDDEICTARQYSITATAEEKCYWDDSSDNGSVYGVTYSFSRQTGPADGTCTLSYAATEAVKKLENKELDALLKNEYEIVDSNDSDEDDDFELI
jgi:hypothetical protein